MKELSAREKLLREARDLGVTIEPSAVEGKYAVRYSNVYWPRVPEESLEKALQKAIDETRRIRGTRRYA